MTTHRYVPIIRWRQGEQRALRELSAGARPGVTPLILLLPDHYKPPSATAMASKKGPKNEGQQFIKLVQEAKSSNIFVDASALPGTAKHHSLDDIAAAARAAGISLVPAAVLNAGADYKAAVSRVTAKDGKGMALRVSFAQMNGAAAWTASLPLSPKYIDLIVDLTASVSEIASLGGAVIQSFGNLHQGTAWRSVTLAGGCIPVNLGGFSHGLTIIDRDEFVLWQSINNAGMPYRLDFGDYGSVWPGPPITAKAAPPVNAKYALRNKYMIFRGVKTKGPIPTTKGIPAPAPMDEQFRDHSKLIVGQAGRGKLAHCWADGLIDGYATSTSGSCGNVPFWVGVSQNRHFEITRHHLP